MKKKKNKAFPTCEQRNAGKKDRIQARQSSSKRRRRADRHTQADNKKKRNADESGRGAKAA